jgi:hypothetical protein
MDRAAHTGLPRGLEEVPTAGPRYWDVRIAVVISAAPGAPAHAIEPSTKEHFLEQRTSIKRASESAGGKGRLRRKTNKV